MIVFLVNLAILSDLQTQMLLVIECLTRHNSLGTQSFRYSALGWKKFNFFTTLSTMCTVVILGIRSNGSGIFKWWVDASFAVNPNMCGNSGGGLSLGRGFPIVSSTKQKLYTRSSMEMEIVGADDFMPEICWTRYFMKAQGYVVKDNVLFQDNTSSIILEKNGKASSSKRTKHINIRYVFITERVSKE
jgi:hypothetical protein